MSVGAGIIGADIALDARDLIHTIDTWEWSWSKAGELGPNQLQYDHAISVKNGGNTTIDNIQSTCRTCNNQKSSRDTLEFLNDLDNGEVLKSLNN